MGTTEEKDDTVSGTEIQTQGEENGKNEDQKSTDLNTGESQTEHIPYPKSVFFIISNEFCERFSFYGMRTILSIYLHFFLKFSEEDSTIIYHAFVSLGYFFPLVGAIISDSWLGKYRTILYVSIIYAAGNIVMALASATPLGLPEIPFSMLGLVLIAIGTGGIKPCVSSFGGDQFVLPQQEKQLVSFFSIFYFAINAGSLISTFLTPVLREVHCLGEDSCYPLAFGVPGALMVISLVIFILGTPMYKMKRPEGNIVVEVCKCIGHGISQKFKAKDNVDHWLDRSEARFGKTLVNDVKTLLKVLVLFIPLPIFWALYDQQGSGWTFQATRMDGDIGFYTILPDQMQVVNSVLILVFIPLFTYGVYPLLAKCHLARTPLQRMVLGGFTTAVAFAISAGVSMVLEEHDPVLASAGNAQIRIYNPSGECDLQISPDVFTAMKGIEVPKMEFVTISGDWNKGFSTGNKLTVASSSCPEKGYEDFKNFTVAEGEALFYSILPGAEKTYFGVDEIDKQEDGLPMVRLLVDDVSSIWPLSYIDDDGNSALKINSTNHTLVTLDAGTYKLQEHSFDLKQGGVYTVLLNVDSAGKITKLKLHVVTEPNSVHMLWLLPQYFLITAGEILFSITGLEFSYSQASVAMKSVLTSAFLLTTAFGDLIIIIITSATIFEKQSNNFWFYTGLMVVDMLIFAWMAMRYKYITKPGHEDDKDENESDEQKKKY